MKLGVQELIIILIVVIIIFGPTQIPKLTKMFGKSVKGFKEGKVRVLVATGIASRGIDVSGVDLVVNMELPVETESYVHRIGRTARAGKGGAAISFVAPEERGLLKAVERFIRKTIPVDRDQPYHCDIADRKSGHANEGLPQAPWIHPANRNRNNKKRHGRKSFLGRRQVDFGQKGRRGKK